MAELIIHFKDTPTGPVCVSAPTFSDLMLRVQNAGPSQLTPAEVYTLHALRAVRDMSQSADANHGQLIVRVPRIIS